MKINVAAEMKRPGKTSECDAVLDKNDLEFCERMIHFVSPINVKLRYVFDGDGINVSGAVDTMLSSECARCATPFDEPFGFEFSERFVKNASEDDECYPFSGEELELEKMLLDNIYLNLPFLSLCREDCKGLCPICGCDLNYAQCSCVAEDRDNPLSVLKTLLKDDKEV